MRIFAHMLFLSLLVWVESLWAADCPDANYNLSTQRGVDLFPSNCEEIAGDLIISDNFNESIANLDGLSNLRSVRGTLRIARNRLLTDLDGLSSLVSVGAELYVDDNRDLTNLDGLSALTAVDYIRVSGNASLTNLNGLRSVQILDRSLIIDANTSLSNLDGLANLSSVADSLQITVNTALTNVDGLANLNSVGDYLQIVSNPALTNIDALANLNSVADSLLIGDNDALTNVDGLANLTSVGSALVISSNLALTNIDGLANLTSVGLGLGITQNSALTNIDGLANLNSVGDYLQIGINPALTNVDGLASLTSVGSHFEIFKNNALTNCQGVAPVLGWPSGPPEDDVGGLISMYRNEVGCDSPEQVLATVSGPTQPVITEATTSSNGVSLGFTPTTTTDTLFPITGYSASCTGSEVDVSGSPATDLLDNTPVQEALTVSGYDPTAVLSSIEVDIDITHSDPTDLYITLTTPAGTELILWNQGSSGVEDLIGTFPTTLTAVDSLDSVTRQTMDGDWVLSIEDIDVGPLVREGVLNSWGIRITEELTRSGSGSPIEVSGVTRGRDYTCTVAPVTKLGTTPVSDSYTVYVPLELPSAPTITSTDYEDGKIILTVSVSDNGGTDITGYEATCSDGTNTFTGTSTSSPIIVSGLTNDVAYTCTVSATNSVGTSSASSETAPIIPELTDGGLPIWLLYEATQ